MSRVNNGIDRVYPMDYMFQQIQKKDDLIDTNLYEIYGKLDANDAQLAESATNLKIASAMPIQNLRIMMHFHYQDNADKIRLVKQLGFNTIYYKILPSVNDTLRQLDMFQQFGIYAILNVDYATLLTGSYASEQARITSVESHPAVIGFSGRDEPVFNHTPKADQETIYNRIKAVTKKNVFLTETAPTIENLTAYYTEKAFDVFLLDLYFNSGTPDQNSPALIISSISNYVMLLKNSAGIVPPKMIIPVFPLFADGFFHEPTLQELKAHIDGWKPFSNGSYAVFGFDNLIGLVSSVDSSENLRKMATIIPSYYVSDSQDTPKNFMQTLTTWADAIFNKGIKIIKPRSNGLGLEIEGMNSGHIRVRPTDDTSPDSPMIYGTNADVTANNFLITKAGRGIFTGGVTIGGGQTIKKWMSANSTLNFGSIPANSSVDVTLAMTGVLLGDSISATPYGSPSSALMWCAYVNANDSVRVRVYNISAAPVSFNNLFYIDVWRH